MVKHYNAGDATVFSPKHPPGQRATDYQRWTTATEAYQIEYERRYEPWGIMYRYRGDASPLAPCS